jgi:hypothetical protein
MVMASKRVALRGWVPRVVLQVDRAVAPVLSPGTQLSAENQRSTRVKPELNPESNQQSLET